MDQILNLLRRKERLAYDINCVKHYMEGGDYDKSLEKVWEDYIVEMDSLKEEILSYLEVHGEELYEEQQELKEKVWEHREEISHLKERIMQLDKLLSNSKPA